MLESSFAIPDQSKRRPLATLAHAMADGKRPSLEVEERPERGTRATKRLRREGYVPGVVYGGTGEDCISFKVNTRVLRAALLGGSALIDLKVGGGKARPVVVKDQQRHPV